MKNFEKDFEYIFDEIKRQYDIILEIDKSHDSKISLILGFNILGIVGTFLSGNLSQFSYYPLIFGFILIGISLISGLIGYYIRYYGVGGNISDFMESYKSNKYKSMKQKIGIEIYRAYEKNRKIGKKRALLIKIMFITFILGFGFVIASRLIFLC